VLAGFAQAHASQDYLPDAEIAIHEVIEWHTACHHVASESAWCKDNA
jgi:hypothetical protein